MKIALGQATAQVVSASITSLVEGVLTSMLLNTFKWAGLAVLVCGLAFTGVGVMARQNTAAKNEDSLHAVKTLAVNAEPRHRPGIAENVAAPKANAKDEPPNLADLRKELLKAARSNGSRRTRTISGITRGSSGPIRPQSG